MKLFKRSKENAIKEFNAKGLLKVKSTEELLGSGVNKKLIREIYMFSGFPESYFKEHCLPAIYSYADYMQDFMASRHHHHSYAGGLLTHTLEVVRHAMKIRRGLILPPGMPPEEAGGHEHIWTYSVFVCALLHDSGKCLVDFMVKLKDAKGNDLGRWSPYLGPMNHHPKAAYYSIKYVPSEYSLHPQLGLYFLAKIVPGISLDWLSRDMWAYKETVKILTGERTDLIGEILKKADQHSTAKSLGSTAAMQTQTVDKEALSLTGKVLKALRYLFYEKQAIKLNKPGAQGFCFDDDVVWFVSKTILDMLRAQLVSDGIKVPANNTRLMDMLQEEGHIIPSEKGAIWKGEINLTDWQQELSLLKVPFQTLCPLMDEDAPKAEGFIRLKGERQGEAKSQEKSAEKTTQESEVNVEAKSEEPKTVSEESTRVVHESAPSGNTEASKADASPSIASDDELFGFSSDPESGEGIAEQKEAASAVKESVQAEDSPKMSRNEIAKDVMNWIREGVDSGKLPFNVKKARIHVVGDKKQVLLVSPMIFRDYIKQCESEVSLNAVQAAFQSLRIHLMNSETGENIHKITIQGKEKKVELKGFLLSDWENVFAQEPPKNKNIKN